MNMTIPRTFLPPFVFQLAIGIYLLFGIGSNSLLALGAVIVLIAGCALLWRPGETPVALYVFFFQWLQASLSVFYANWKGTSIDDLSMMAGGGLGQATILSLLGVLCLAIGFRLGAGPPDSAVLSRALHTISRQPPSAWLRLYAIAWIVGSTASALSLFVPALSQPLGAVAGLKWAAFFIFTFTTFLQRNENLKWWLAAFAIELASSIGGYFATFRYVFLFTLIGIGAANLHRVKITATQFVGGAAVAAILMVFVVYWTAIKMEYRDFANGGSASQVVVVSPAQRLEKIGELLSQVDSDAMAEAQEMTIKRIAYVEFFGAVLSYVPNVVPYEKGALWLDAITRPFMPRIFFPEKAILDDSIETQKYTGIGVAGTEAGTSISIGYMAESYIDFGEFGMMAPIFGIWYVIGRVYRWLTRGILGMGLSTATILISAEALEQICAKLVGALFVSVLIDWILLKFIVPRFLPWLRD